MADLAEESTKSCSEMPTWPGINKKVTWVDWERRE